MSENFPKMSTNLRRCSLNLCEFTKFSIIAQMLSLTTHVLSLTTNCSRLSFPLQSSYA